jgi:hypothetical protein
VSLLTETAASSAFATLQTSAIHPLTSFSTRNATTKLPPRSTIFTLLQPPATPKPYITKQ